MLTQGVISGSIPFWRLGSLEKFTGFTQSKGAQRWLIDNNVQAGIKDIDPEVALKVTEPLIPPPRARPNVVSRCFHSLRELSSFFLFVCCFFSPGPPGAQWGVTPAAPPIATALHPHTCPHTNTCKHTHAHM